MNQSESPVKKRDVGIAGILVILSQIISSYQNSSDIKSEFAKLKQEVEDARVNTQKYFVKKEELKTVVKKLDRMNTELVKLNEQLQVMKDTTAFLEPEDLEDVLSCGVSAPLDEFGGVI